jgi:putative oxidoreductase
MNKFIQNNSEYFYLVFRVIIGVVFFMHGLMKWGAVSSLSFSNLMFYAGLIELIGGAFLVLGLFIRPLAMIAAVEMVFAWFMAHVSKGWNPLQNGGEPAVLFFAAFLVLVAYGAGKYSIDNKIRNR